MKLEKKLSLSKETLRSLNQPEVASIVGGQITRLLPGQDACLSADCLSFNTHVFWICQ